MLEFLTDRLRKALLHINLRLVYELRVRANKPLVVNYGGKYIYLGPCGLTAHKEEALLSDVAEIEAILCRASEYSVYSVTEQLRQGFLTGAGGERIGLAGVFVYEDGSSFTVKDVTSLNIRVPHEVIGCGQEIYRQCFSDKLRSMLLISSPGRGKTTILRDLARLLCADGIRNVLVNDERNEISASYRNFSLDTGLFSDVIRFSYKRDALTAAVRAMRPDVIVTDELVSCEEVEAVSACVRGGVEVIASAHCRDLENLRQSPIFASALRERVFERYVVLSSEGIGRVQGIYDATLCSVGGVC